MKKSLKKAAVSEIGGRFSGLFKGTEESDMHLPDWILGFGLVLIVAAVVIVILGAAAVKALLIGAALLIGGVLAVLCYRNQKIFVTSDETFEYRTFMGNVRSYRFDEIEKLMRNKDSMTLFVRGEKVHIESSAVLSDRLVKLIQDRL